MAPLNTAATHNLLVEVFVEELPPKALRKLGDAFASGLLSSLQSQGLASASAKLSSYATPRRLAAHVQGVSAQAAAQAVSHKLMPTSVGLDAKGQATPALLKKLAALGADASAVAQLQKRVDGKAEALFLDAQSVGVTLTVGLQKALDETLARLPIPKVMQYQLADGWQSVQFVRPAHGLVALHGSAIVDVQALGLRAGRLTHGHRFEAAVDPIELRNADDYADALQTQGAVIASFEQRRSLIEHQLQAAASAIGLKPIEDEALLDEVTALVERPNVLTCGFERAFLEVPAECLILTMKANQKYFPLLDANGHLSERFLVVSNVSPADPSRVIEGNERVVRPRLADAKFFFDQDRKKSLASRVDGLERVVYHGKLGTQAARSLRVRQIAQRIAAAWPLDAAETAHADRAALLAKADLLTDMVGEFPELQGTMGGYYARHDGEAEPVVLAIEDHYKPRFAGDALPRGPAGVMVALADKLETLVGLFGIGQLPTGDRDPYALRRHAIGVLRMLIEVPVPIGIEPLVAMAVPPFADLIKNPTEALLTFMRERLAGSLRDEGYSAREIEAVLAQPPALLAELKDRLAAVRSFSALPEAEALAAANKRVANILRKSESERLPLVNAALFTEPAEAALHAAMAEIKPQADAAFERGDYRASLQCLAALRQPVDAFFEAVMVNVDDAALRANRLGLLAQLHSAMNRVADLSKLAS